jgi:perosamine synthetase
MCVTDDPRLAERLRSLRDHAMDPRRRYWHDVIGYSYRMTNLQAALGVAQVRKIAAIIERKRRLAGWYADMLAPLAATGRIRLHPEAPWAASVFWLYSVLVAGGRVSRDEALTRLDARGIEARPFFWPLHLLPPYARGARMAVAEDLGGRGISLPSGLSLDRSQVARIVRALGDALDA